jgi:flagellar biosynthesis component FlhA
VVRLLKALVEENVPIVALRALCRAFIDGFQAQADLDTLLQSSRLLPEVRPQLPGFRVGPLISLHADIESKILAGLRSYGDEHLLLLDPELTQETLSAFRYTISEVPEESPPAVVVVENGLARRYIRKLVELEFPDLIVLAKAELDPVEERKIEKTVSFDAD